MKASNLFSLPSNNRLVSKNRFDAIYVMTYYLFNNFLYDRSMANAPSGAVITMARTATVSTVSPQAKPNASGIPPIAA